MALSWQVVSLQEAPRLEELLPGARERQKHQGSTPRSLPSSHHRSAWQAWPGELHNISLRCSRKDNVCSSYRWTVEDALGRGPGQDELVPGELEPGVRAWEQHALVVPHALEEEPHAQVAQ